jgi:hypothetical protein
VPPEYSFELAKVRGGGDYDLFSGEALKQAGIDLVTDNNIAWMTKAIDAARAHLPDGLLMAEDFRRILLPHVGAPENPNAWGALVRHCRRMKIVEPTGEYRKSSSVMNHGHHYMTYRKVSG